MSMEGYLDYGISCGLTFRIHEFNVQQVMALFLPYHESPHFAKMLTILQIQ